MEKKCLIYYKGTERDVLDKYCREIEDIGFSYDKRIELATLDYDVARFIYAGDDFESDKKKIESLDDKISIEIINEYRISF